MGSRRGLLSLLGFLVASVVAFPVWSPPVPAAPLRLTLNCGAANGNVCDSANPCLDGVTNCRSTNGAAWNDNTLATAMAPLLSKQTGSATDIDLSAYCTGANCGSATYQLQVAVATWSIGGTGTKHLLNAGSVAGSSATSGPLKLQVCYAGQCDTGTFDWAYQASVTDTTAPPIPVWLAQTGGGTGTATLEWQTVSDASGNVQSSGMASYSIRNTATGALIDTLNSVGPGLLLTHTAYNIGSAPGTNTCTQSGLTWTIQNAGAGFEATDQGEVCGAPVSGDFTAIATATNLPYLSDWSKVGFNARESSANNAADAECYFMNSQYGWYLQWSPRAVTGNDYRSGIATLTLTNTATPSPLPLKILLRRHGDLWDCAESTDGQSWTYAVVDRSMPMVGTLIVGPMATPTSLGTAMTATMDQLSISNTGRVSKTLTLAGPTSVAVRAIDVANNASLASVAVTLTPGSASSGVAKKWHPGYYPFVYRDPPYRYDQAARFGRYDQFAAVTTFKGMTWNATWKALEGDTPGSYNDSMILAEVAHLKTQTSPKRFMLMLDDEVYRGTTNDYPAYVVNAGCVAQELWNGTATMAHFKYWIPQCATYRANLITHLGALLDSEPYFEGIILDYEQAYTNSLAASFAWSDFLAGVTTIVQAAAAAFPHTNISWRENWGPQYHEANLVDLLAIMKTNHVGWGGEDACSQNPVTWAYIQDGSLPSYIDADNIFAGYGGWDGNHQPGLHEDQRGKMYSNSAVENSELGYNSVCGANGATGYYYPAGDGDYFSLWNWWNDALHVSHANVDLNEETGISQQRWNWSYVQYSLSDMIATKPLTHTQCPTDYDNAFGNGSPGSGCNTN